MNDYTDAWSVITPFGPVVVDFPDDGPAVIAGNSLAADHLQQVMAEQTNRMGQTMTLDNLEPYDLLFFCQVDGVCVVPPLDFLDPEENDPMNAVTLDSASESLASLRQTLKATVGVRERLAVMGKMVADR